MYPYSNYPNENPNGQGNVPPYNYTENPNTPPPYPPYNYQGRPQGQPPYYNYPPEPPRPSYSYMHPALRAFGIVLLVLFILSMVGHHSFFFFPFFPLVIFAIIMAATRGSHYRSSCNRPYYRHQHYNYWNNPYQYQGRPYNYDYSQTPPPPGYYGPQQPPQPQAQVNNQGWPAPKDPYKNEENMENPY